VARLVVAPISEDEWQPHTGIGASMSDLAAVVENMSKVTRTSDVLLTAHRLMFNKRGKQKDLKV
jgi:hypothetical protein